MRGRGNALLAAIAACICISGALGARGGPLKASQSALVVNGSPLDHCPECRSVQLVREVVLGGGGDFASVCHPNAFVVLDQDSRWYLAPACEDGKILVFDPDGTPLPAIELRDEGVTNILRLWFLGPDDLYVAALPALHTFYSLSADSVARSILRFPIPYDVVDAGAGRTVQSLNVPTTERAGYPLHVVEHSGELALAFGSSDPVFRITDATGLLRSLAASADGSVWAGHFRPYRIERWGTDGELLETIDRSPSWFTEPTDDGLGPWVHSIREDAQGRLWVVSTIPRNSWHIRDGGTPNDHFDTVVDVLDPASGAFVATGRFSQALSRWAGEHLYSFRVRDGGFVVDVWQVQLAGEETATERRE